MAYRKAQGPIEAEMTLSCNVSWPTGDFESARDVALDTAMNYLEHTGQAENLVDVQRVGRLPF
jgi:hypothetical protein